MSNLYASVFALSSISDISCIRSNRSIDSLRNARIS